VIVCTLTNALVTNYAAKSDFKGNS